MFEEKNGGRGTDVDEVAAALGQSSMLLAAGGDLESFADRLRRLRPDLVINLVPDAPDIAAVLDLLDLTYTGAGPAGLYLATDPGMSRRLLASHGVPAHGGPGHDFLVGMVGGELLPASELPGDVESIGLLLHAAEAALRLRDYGLYAVRIGEDGVMLDGATPNPSLAKDGPLAACANRAGWTYDQLIARIVASAEERNVRPVVSQPVL